MSETKFMGRCRFCHFLTVVELDTDKQETHTGCTHCGATVRVERVPDDE